MTTITFPNSPCRLHQPFEPAGDKPAAIEKLVEGINDGLAYHRQFGLHSRFPASAHVLPGVSR